MITVPWKCLISIQVLLSKEILSIKLIIILQVQKTISTYSFILDLNLLGERKFSLSTDIQLMIIKVQELQKTLWVGDLFILDSFIIKSFLFISTSVFLTIFKNSNFVFRKFDKNKVCMVLSKQISFFHDSNEFFFTNLSITISISLINHFLQLFISHSFAQLSCNSF